MTKKSQLPLSTQMSPTVSRPTPAPISAPRSPGGWGCPPERTRRADTRRGCPRRRDWLRPDSPAEKFSIFVPRPRSRRRHTAPPARRRDILPFPAPGGEKAGGGGDILPHSAFILSQSFARSSRSSADWAIFSMLLRSMRSPRVLYHNFCFVERSFSCMMAAGRV